MTTMTIIIRAQLMKVKDFSEFGGVEEDVRTLMVLNMTPRIIHFC